MKPYYEESGITIYNADCREILPSLSEVDLVLTSPPYDNLRDYQGYSFDFEPIARELYRITTSGGVLVWVVSDETVNGSESGTSFRQALYFKDACGFNLHDTMIYEVKNTGAKGSNLSYWQSFEYMFVFSKGRPKTVNWIQDKKNKKWGSVATNGKKQRATGTRLLPIGGIMIQEIGIRGNVWEYLSGNNGDDATDHPAVFPEALANDHIRSWSNSGDTVLDPFMGSGTTGKMARLNGCNFTGVEISEAYCEIAANRLRQEVLQFD